jgi:hypothetical protein
MEASIRSIVSSLQEISSEAHLLQANPQYARHFIETQMWDIWQDCCTLEEEGVVFEGEQQITTSYRLEGTMEAQVKVLRGVIKEVCEMVQEEANLSLVVQLTCVVTGALMKIARVRIDN